MTDRKARAKTDAGDLRFTQDGGSLGWVSGLEGVVVEGFGVGAGEAEALVVAVDEAVEVDAFVAAIAGDAGAFVAGKLAGGERDADPLGAEEVFVWEFAVGLHLLRVLFEIGVEFAGAVFGGLEGYDAEGFVIMALVVVGV